MNNQRFAPAMLSIALLAAVSSGGVNPEPGAIPGDSDARQVVAFWRDAGPALWFAKDPAFDARFRARFAQLYETARRGGLAHWLESPDQSLALILLLDQYPRNSFRGTVQMYATDEQARQAAEFAVSRGHDRHVEPDLQVFMYLPFAHSENLVDQDRSVELVRRLGEPHLSHAEHHRDIIRRFGRFPHRNPILGRETKAEEQTYLDDGGYRG